MRSFSAQYVFTNTGPRLKRPVIHTLDDGTITGIEETGGMLTEKNNVEFYNGIIIPGFINCHCHLELSHLHNQIEPGKGLHNFLTELNSKRFRPGKDQLMSAAEADRSMQGEGIVLCADLCNSSLTFSIKQKSLIKYINLIEVFGIDHNKAGQRINEALLLARESDYYHLPRNITPHSAYSVPLPLLRLIKENASANKVSSIHFLESESELSFLEDHSGPLYDAYLNFLPPGTTPVTVKDHLSAVLEEITGSGNLILVHNTFIGKKQIRALRKRENLFYCLCPRSNLQIEKKLPPVELLMEENCTIVTGTDSLSSNNELSMVSELKTLSSNFPSVKLETLIKWATLNGAAALSETSWAGTIEPGKKPGLVLLKNIDLRNLRLLPRSSAVRLI